MGESNAKKEGSRPERKFSWEQYDILRRCSEKKDITEWNQWCRAHRHEDILLEGARLPEAHLEGAYLSGAHLERAILPRAHLEGAHLWRAHLERAFLLEARLQGAFLLAAHLEGARLEEAHLEGAYLGGAHLEAAYLWQAHLEGAVCRAAIVDGSTYLSGCTVDRNTDFNEVGLDSARMEPGLKQLLKYSGRRRNWQGWYGAHSFKSWVVRRFWLESPYGKCNSFWESPARWLRLLCDFCERKSFLNRLVARLHYAAGHIKRSPIWKSPVWWFWWVSDYGQSTGRIIAVFFLLALIFAAVYYFCGLGAGPGIVANLFVDRCGLKVPGALVPVRAIYFSVVTMTTLGFGDMHAYAGSFWGHILLMLQVLLGYVLLGALITRFAVLFQAEGPAGKFSPEYKGPKASG